MGLDPQDAQGRHINLGDLDPRPRPAAREKEPPKDKPLDAATTKIEVCRGLCTIYNLSHKILHDDERYTASDFSEEADGLIELMNQHAPLRILMRILVPLAAFGAILEKIEGTVSRFRARRAVAKMVEGQQEESPNADVTVVTNMPNGLAGDQVRGRPIFR